MCTVTNVDGLRVFQGSRPYALFGEPLIKVCSESGTDYCDLTGEAQWIKRMIDKLVDSQIATAPSTSDIAKAVAREMQITMESLRGPSRKSSVVRARGLAMLLMRHWTDVSFQNIGEYFGGRDHTTVMHACKKTEEDLAKEVDLERMAERIRQKLKN